jgi:adenylate cyclase
VTCAACGSDNLAGNRFCGGCGAALARSCPACAHPNPPEHRFCGACGAPLQVTEKERPLRDALAYTPKHLADKILTSRSALEGERKQVTVLFADVKGSMELAEQLDPEAWHAILDRFFAILSDGVHRFEGTVNQYTGDGIMALFGAPIAHEDHAQRACYAALHLQGEIARYATELKREHGVGFQTRLGIHSGEVVVGKIGDDLRMDYTAQGHTVGLAQRMEALAEPNTCYLSATTAALAGGYFALEDLGEFRVKGVAEPVRVHRLAGLGAARTRFDISRARGLSRFVGRAADLRTLEDALEQTAAGNGQVVGVVAEAGTGKSRLCFEFLERCRARGMRVLEGHAVAHGKNIPLLPILEVYRAAFGITLTDDDRNAREKIAGRMVLVDQKFADALPLLFDFLGVADPQRPAPALDPEARQRQLLAVMRQLVQTTSTTQTTVTLIEDLHWLDAASELFVEHMVDARAGSRNLLLLNFRPEYHAEWMQKSWYRQIPLTPLGREAIAELLADLLGKDPSLAALADPIHQRTRGNPFFTEEVLQSLIESGHLTGTRGAYRLVTPVEQLEVPATVQFVLAARIDRLPEREKRLLQVASVIGPDFSEPLLAAVAELPAEELKAALAALRRAEFVHEQALYPVAEYSFKHPLTQEVALGSQLRERRRKLHAAVAHAIESQDTERLDERAALLAHHFEEADEALLAARWHRRAADWANRSDIGEARRHAERVRALVARLPESPERVELGVAACTRLLLVGGRMGISEAEAAALFEEGRALASGNARLLGELLIRFAGARLIAFGDGAGAIQLGREALTLADREGDPVLRVTAQAMLMSAHSLCGPIDAVEQLYDAILSASRETRERGLGLATHPMSLIVATRALALAQAGRLAEGVREAERALALAAEEGAYAQCLAHGFRSLVAWRQGDAATAGAHARQALALAEQLGAPGFEASPRAYLGMAHMLEGRADEAVEALESALSLLRTTRATAVSEAIFLNWLAEAELLRGNAERACALSREAVDLTGRRGLRMVECTAHRLRALSLLRAHAASAQGEALDELARCEALIHELGLRLELPHLHTVRAELARTLGDEPGCARELREAQRLFVEMGAFGRAERLGKELEP